MHIFNFCYVLKVAKTYPTNFHSHLTNYWKVGIRCSTCLYPYVKGLALKQ